jgi:hypothetical protein
MKEAQKKRNQSGLFLPNREVSWVVAAALFLCFTIFALGYFWGQRRVVSSFLGKMEEESFADKITYSLYAMNGRDTGEEDGEDESGSEDSDEMVEEKILNNPTGNLLAINTQIKKQDTIKSDDKKTEAVITQKLPEKVYVAPIVGFGTLHAAQSFAQRVKKSGINVIIKDRNSITAKGKQVSWYQAVSDEYTDKSDLQSMLALLQKKENIKEVKIIEKRKVDYSC